MVTADGAATAAGDVAVIDQKQRQHIGLNLLQLVDVALDEHVDGVDVGPEANFPLAEWILLDRTVPRRDFDGLLGQYRWRTQQNVVFRVLADIFPEAAALVGVFVLGRAEVNPALRKVDGNKKGRLGDVLGHRKFGAGIDVLVGIVGVVTVRFAKDQLDRDDDHGSRGAGVGVGGIGSHDHRSVLLTVVGKAIGPLGQLGGGRLHRIVRVGRDREVHGAGLGRSVVLGKSCGSQTYASKYQRSHRSECSETSVHF